MKVHGGTTALQTVGIIDIFVTIFIAALGEKVGSMRYVNETMNYIGIEVGNMAYLSVGSS